MIGQGGVEAQSQSIAQRNRLLMGVAVLYEKKQKREFLGRFPFVVPPSGGLDDACPPPAEAGTTYPERK
jgi:hypothetical protein